MTDIINKLGDSSYRYDYGHPFARCTIVTTDGIRVPLWTNLALKPEEQEAIGLWDYYGGYSLNALPYVQEVSIELQPAYLAIMKVRLLFPYREGIAFLNSRLVEWGYSTLEVIMGYTGGSPQGPRFFGQQASGVLSPSFTGVIMQPEIEIGSQISVTLNAQGTGGFAAVGTTRTGGPYVDSRKELIKRFAKGPNELVPRQLKLDFSKVEPPARGLESPEVEKLAERIEVSPGGRTDWNIMFDLVNEAGCWMTLVGDTLHITPKSDLSGPVTRVFRFFNYPNGDASSGTGTYPIISASSVAPAIYLPSATLGAWSADIESGDPTKIIKRVINHEEVPQNTTGKGNVGPAATSTTPTTSATASDINNGNQDGLGFFVGSPSNPKWVDKMREDHRKWSGNIGIHLNINTVGIPDIMPLENIAVRGLGDRMDTDSNYSIFKIIHTIGLSGFTTYLECFSNVGGQIARELLPPQNKGQSSPATIPEPVDPDTEPAKVDTKPKKKTKEEQELDKLLNDIAKDSKKPKSNVNINKLTGRDRNTLELQQLGIL